MASAERSARAQAARPPPRWWREPHDRAHSENAAPRSEEHTSELQALRQLVCRLLLEKNHTRKPEPRWYALHLGDYPRCPRCGTFRLTRLATRDKIDKMLKGFFFFVPVPWGVYPFPFRDCLLH